MSRPAALLLLLCALVPAASAAVDEVRVLVFTKTEGFRHDAIPAAVDALRELGQAAGWRVDHGEDAAAFTPARLGRYRIVVFASTTGDVLDARQQAALRTFVEGGGGFVGIHAAADTEYGWPWYGQLVGARFRSHPPGLQDGRVTFADDGIAPDGRTWRVTDEFYAFREGPGSALRTVATLDRRDDGTPGPERPIAWCQSVGEGRSWYTALGHNAALYADATFRRHLWRGLQYAAGVSVAC